MSPKMISTCRFKDFFLGKQFKCIEIFAENTYFRTNSEMELKLFYVKEFDLA